MQPLSRSDRVGAPLVLLVDDDTECRDMYRMALEFDGFDVVDSPTVFEAVDRATAVLPDIVIADLGKFDDSAVNVARRLKSDPRTSSIPMLAVTGADPRSLGPTAALFDQVLLKPVLPEDLSARIRAILKTLRRQSSQQFG